MSDLKNTIDIIEELVKYLFEPEKISTLLPAVIIFLSYKYEFFTGAFYKIKNKKLNELSFYREKIKSESLAKYINLKIDEIIERRVTKVNCHKERMVFMYVSSCRGKWHYGDIVLRNIISYIRVGKRLRIDFKKYKENRSGYVRKFILYLISMVATIIISFYFKVYNHSDYGFFLSLIIMGFFEVLAINNHSKIFKLKHLQEYNSALKKIDATVFISEYINDSSYSLTTPPPVKSSSSQQN